MKQERYIEMSSPLTGGRVKEVRDEETHSFRGRTYTVNVHYYICEDTGEQFTCDGQDDLVMNQVYNYYRTECGIPFPEEIAAIRRHYDLKQTQISKIAGFGINQWKNYEDGDMPSESNARLILTLKRADSMLTLLESSRNSFSAKEYDKLYRQISLAGDYSTKSLFTEFFYGETPYLGIMNGFGPQSPQRVMAMARWFVDKLSGITPTKLNKLMFYGDFLNYRKTGRSISGLRYRAIQHGPVPEHYDTIYDNVPGLEKRVEIHHDRECSEYYLVSSDDARYCTDAYLTPAELDTLSEVMSKYGSLSTSEIVEVSHKEPAWLQHHSDKSLIPYSEAFLLNAGS